MVTKSLDVEQNLELLPEEAASDGGDPQDELGKLLPQLNSAQALGDLIEPLVLRLPSGWRLTDDALVEFFLLNEPMTFERTKEGHLVITPLAHGPSSALSVQISYQLMTWVYQGGGGEVRGEGGGYKFGPTPPPDEEEKQAERAPDVSWYPQHVLDAIPLDVYEDQMLDICPPFVVEVVSAKQRVRPLHNKMREYISHGVQLGWLIDRKRGKAWIYRAGQDQPEELDHPATLSGESVLEGFELDCAKIWR